MVKLVVLAWLLAACGSSSKPSVHASKPEPTPAGDPTCPASVPGTSVTAEDTANGGALVFVTTGDVADLRKRVEALAAKHNAHHSEMGPLPTGTEDAGGGHHHHDDGKGVPPGYDGTITVHSRATNENIEGGAKLVYISFPDGVARIQGELRFRAQKLASGTCP